MAMKKLTSLRLSLIFILSIFLVLPPASQASISIGNCDENWQKCRSGALQSDDGFIKTTLSLAACDLDHVRCLLIFR
jgi:hypothetical protein